LKRVLSGIQASGKVHIGNYLGAISNWVKLQDKYETYYFIADLHALTTAYENKVNIYRYSLDVAKVLIGAGIDPQRTTLFLQSAIPEHCELHLIFSMLTPLSWLERVPTYKSKLEEEKERDLKTYGFLGYPVLQAADITLYQADLVPVGRDQLPHLELTREIVRRFNFLYGNFFKEPQELLTEYPVLPGVDGRKMSKSYNNTIDMIDDQAALQKKVQMMVTDPQRIKKTDKGHPEVCSVYHYQGIFNKPEVSEIETACKSGSLGCVECKKKLVGELEKVISPVREKTLKISDAQIKEILQTGSQKAGQEARQTLEKVKDIIKLR
jgi:tryptophanyl-tRNA synthetase